MSLSFLVSSIKDFRVSRGRKFALAGLPVWLAAGLGCGTVSATVIFNDSFVAGSGDYSTATSNTTLSGETSASSVGFTGAWAGSASAINTTQDFNNLSLSGISNPGTAVLRIAPANNGDFGRVDYRSLSATASAATAAASTVWFGCIFQPETNAVNPAAGTLGMLGLLSGALPTTSGTKAQATWDSTNGKTLGGFALGLSSGSLNISYQSAANTGGNVASSTLSTTLTTNTPYFLVSQLTINSADNDTLNVWLRTSVPSTSAGLGTADFTVTGDLLTAAENINTLNAYSGQINSGLFTSTAFDALTLGTSYNDLISVPEPSTPLCVGAIVLIAVFGYQRLRRNESAEGRAQNS